jgi:hypothetical protein
MNTPIYYVGGSKGGVGKSLVSFALVDYLINRDQRVLLIDTDNSNPDVYKAHKDAGLPALACKMRSLDDADGWAAMLNTVESHPEHVELLHSFQRIFSDTPIHVCRNLYFGTPDRFDVYNGSKIREALEPHGMTLDFPELASRVVDTLYSGRTPIWRAISESPLGNRVELLRWQSRCTAMFDRALSGTVEAQG